MKLNKEIYSSDRSISIDFLSGIKTTQSLETLVNNGKLQLNNPIDETIFYAVDFNPPDDYFIRSGGNSPHQSEFVKGANTPSGVCAMFGRLNTNDTLQNRPVIANQTRTTFHRLAYDSDKSDSLGYYFGTEYKLKDFLFLVRVIAYRFEYSDMGDVSSFSDRIDVDVQTFETTYKNTHHIVGIYAVPYYLRAEIHDRKSCQGFNIIPFCTYSKNSMVDNYDIYGALFFGGDYDQDHAILNTFIYGCEDLYTNYFNDYDYYYANLGFIDLWDKTYFAINSDVYTGYLPVFDYSIENIHKLYSRMGTYYTFSANLAKQENLNQNGIYCGIISDDGKITGKYSEGAENSKQIQTTWDNPTDWQNNPFNGIGNTDPNNYTDKIDLNKPTLSNVNVFNRSFAVTSNSVRQLADFLWNADETKFDEIVKGLALMGENPMNGIIDLRLFPFNVALKNSATQAEPIVIGRTNTGVNGIKLTENVNSLIDLGECTFFTKFKNFLDYEPYTTAQLYIPYIGVVPVSTAEFMGHRISVKMIVDYTTGAGTAIVFKDDIPFIYRNGVVGVSIPMTGNDSTSYANTVIGNVVSGVVGGVTSIASGNIGGMVSSAEKLYSGFATGTNYQEASASSPSVATWQPQHCYFIIDRPILNAPDNYGRTVGYACEKTGKLSDFKGFTVVSNPEINFRCTDSERQYIVNMLQGGVFV
jgi:hypothetical protein